MSAQSFDLPYAPSPNERLCGLFKGGPWHGTYMPEPCPMPGVKVEIRSTAKTLKGGPTPELWSQHLAGGQPLGVIPICEDDACLWGCIDVDDLDFDHAAMVTRIKRERLPLIVCRSKSGGGHLFLFLSEPVAASAVRHRLREIATALGYAPSTEVFPKHDTASGDQHKHSAWLNMPYFGGDGTDRYAVKDRGLAMSLSEFLEAAENARLTADEFAALKVPPPAQREDRKADTLPAPDEFEKLLDGWLRDLAEAPSGKADDTLMQVARDIGRWASAIEIDYSEVQRRALEAWHLRGKSDADFHAQYHHNLAAGQKRGDPPRLMASGSNKHGGDGVYPNIEKLVVLTGGEEDLWRLPLAGYGEITLPVKEIMNYYTFNVQCAGRLGAVYRHMKVDAWNDRLREARARAECEEVPQDETVEYIIHELLSQFCMDKHSGETIDELLLGKPVQVPEEDRVYFRFEDFQKFLRMGNSKFKNETRQRLGTLIGKTVGKDNYKQTMKVVKGHPQGLPVKWVRLSLFAKPVSLPLPPLDRPPL